MDPFIEALRKWKGFHSQFITGIGQTLVPRVRPRYIVDFEEYVWLSSEEDQVEILVEPDVTISDSGSGWGSSEGAAAVAARPVIRTIPAPKRIRQKHLVIRNRDSLQVVTVIEVLSPRNKRPGDAQREYLAKRQNILNTPANLVELDLLRGGVRLPTTEPLPPGDYYAFVTRRDNDPDAEVYAWGLPDPIRPVPIPLAEGEADVWLDVQQVFATTYDRAGYDYALDYAADIDPPPSNAAAAWVREILAGAPPGQQSSR